MAKMFVLIVVFLILKLSFLFCYLSDPKCYWRIKDAENYLGDKDVDCFFSIYAEKGYVKNDYFGENLDKQVTPKTIHLISSVYFAIEEINRNFHILPNISLLVKIECNLIADNIERVWSMKKKEIIPNYYCKNQRRYLVVLTGPIWITSYKLGPMLYFSRTPEIYCGYFHLHLSDQEQFPHLYQMSPKDTSLPLAMVSLAVYLRWNWVGVIITDDDHGIQFLSELRTRMERNTVCLAFVNIITYDEKINLKMIHKYYEQIIMSSAKVVIVYGDKDSPVQFNFILWKYKNIQRLWVTVSQFDVITMTGDFMINSIHGTLFFSHQQSEMSGFKQFIQTVHPSNYSNDISLAKLWWTYFKCSLPPPNCKTLKNCPTKTLFKWFFVPPLGMSMSETCYNMYNSVYAVAHSLHEMFLQQVDTCTVSDGKVPEFNSWKMFSFLKTIQFVNPAGDLINMNQNRKLDTEYDIFYIMDFLKQYGLKMKIGRFFGHFPNGEQLFVSDEMIEWATNIKQTLVSICTVPCTPGFRKYFQEGKAVCCFDCYRCPENEISNMTGMDQCVKCPEDEYANSDRTKCLKKVVTFLDYGEPLGMVLAGLALCFSALSAVVLCVFLKHRDTPIVKANNETLSYVLLISLLFCSVSSVLYIGHPSMASCILQQTTFAIVFTVSVSSILAKTITVVLAFKITVPGKRLRWLLLSGATNYIVPMCTIIQMILCGIWLGASPPFVDADLHMIHGYIIIVCNKGSVIAFYCVLGYMGSLALASFTVAFLARNLPDTFNEAKLLTFSMLVFCSVWVTFLPVYHSTKGKAMVAVEVFCVLASSAGMLVCIFVPKCYMILLRPQINSIHEFRKMHSKAKSIS
ncbi:vomeronasal type-2 receptor 116-like [Arvicanthis niloticus]|uniref:vomeronasal type-2 receptor 116-like n=1 Tax=Arvicanthis niloticus TaxID=61156 RepID=UPI001486F17F|nr:vomeronasal type-2 receptor 116-like [Arvicanthis niloticus]